MNRRYSGRDTIYCKKAHEHPLAEPVAHSAAEHLLGQLARGCCACSGCKCSSTNLWHMLPMIVNLARNACQNIAPSEEAAACRWMVEARIEFARHAFGLSWRKR